MLSNVTSMKQHPGRPGKVDVVESTTITFRKVYLDIMMYWTLL